MRVRVSTACTAVRRTIIPRGRGREEAPHSGRETDRSREWQRRQNDVKDARVARGGGVAGRRKKKFRTAKEKRKERPWERETHTEKCGARRKTGRGERRTAEVNKWKRWNGDGHRPVRCIWCIPAVYAAPRVPGERQKERDSNKRERTDGWTVGRSVGRTRPEDENKEGVAASERAGRRREPEYAREREKRRKGRGRRGDRERRSGRERERERRAPQRGTPLWTDGRKPHSRP